MDLAEALRGEDISKTDFFDFVTCPDFPEENHRRIKSPSFPVNGSLESLELKEANNNHLSSEALNFDFWNSSGNESMKLETAIFDDLKFWGQTVVSEDSSSNKVNTDGAIYTLTVLNGDQVWFKSDDPGTITTTSVEPSLIHNSHHQQPPQRSSQPAPAPQQNVDLDSFLNFVNGQDHNGYHHSHHPSHSTPTPPNNSLQDSPLTGDAAGTPSTPKQEPSFPSYEESPSTAVATSTAATYTVDVKVEPSSLSQETTTCNSTENTPGAAAVPVLLIKNISSEPAVPNIIVPEPLDDYSWKLTSPDSLLRSALQGKTSFLTRYNGTQKKDMQTSTVNNHSELKRALSTPPGCNQPHTPTEASSPTALFNGGEDSSKSSLGLDPVESMFSNDHQPNHSHHQPTTLRLLSDSEPSSAHCVDEILLSQFPEDFEQLKKIENEVAESVRNYCNTGTTTTLIYKPPLQCETLSNAVLHPSTPQQPTHQPLSSLKGNKKYTKRQNKPPQMSNGIRKERSLHYCTICSKGFKDKYSVNVHIRTHTGEKPFACNLCGKSFRQKAHLAKHYQTHAQKSGSVQKSSKR